jgi:hypothetical protein
MTTIKLKNGSGAPTSGDLAQGEPALDLTNKRLYTEDSGGNVIEVGTNPGVDVTFADNRKAIFGAGSDLQIYHDGSASYISDQGTGNLKLLAGSFRVRNSADTENIMQGNENGTVSLYYDNSVKFATTATGIDVTGTAVTDNAVISGYMDFQTGGANKGNIYTDASTMIINTQGTNTTLNTNGGNVGIGTSSPVSISGYTITTLNNSSSGSALYLQQAAATKGRVITTANELTIDTTAAIPLVFGTNNTERMRIDTSGNLILSGNGGSTSNSVDISYNGSSGQGSFNADSNSGNTFLTFGTSSSGSLAERMRIDSSGNLLVGTTSISVGQGTTTGVSVRGPIGRIEASASSNTSAIFNRTTSPGAIVNFASDGATVGSIATLSGNASFGSGDVHLNFNATSNLIEPMSTVSGGASNGAIDLGGSLRRFKDLYLSGIAYANNAIIGGTAEADGQMFAVNTTNADSSTNEPVVFNNETHSASNAYGILIKYSGSSGNWSSGTGQNFIRCTDNGESNQKFAVTGAGQVQAQVGIAFGGDTAAANTLDDYEEGTWTPTFSNGVGDLSATSLNFNASGRYTKIGRVVYITGVTSTSGTVTGTSSSPVNITGLPFTAGGISAFGGAFVDDSPSYNKPSVRTTSGEFQGGNTIITLKKDGTDDEANFLTSDLAASGNANRIYVSGFYTV